jgi:hypothetical protein
LTPPLPAWPCVLRGGLRVRRACAASQAKAGTARARPDLTLAVSWAQAGALSPLLLRPPLPVTVGRLERCCYCWATHCQWQQARQCRGGAWPSQGPQMSSPALPVRWPAAVAAAAYEGWFEGCLQTAHGQAWRVPDQAGWALPSSRKGQGRGVGLQPPPQQQPEEQQRQQHGQAGGGAQDGVTAPPVRA